MARSVVLESTLRCPRCRFTPRWCVCAAERAVAVPLAVDVLIHRRELRRPTSTGRLINRIVPASRAHLYERLVRPERDAIVRPGRELWILHPRGDPAPAGVPADAVQVLLLDGSWTEAASMLAAVEGWGRRVRVPEAGPSRYWLRGARDGAQRSTIEALIALLGHFGLAAEAAALHAQFELHVYAGLRTRGAKARAEEFLATSALPREFPDLMQQLAERRPNPGSFRRAEISG
ncbi:MAG TPA: DTW domain-containing protein [Lacunisphaera sp.]|jgi:DTW domain-containing protein YfiP|nr:DTW domain-containing protein [Lacunisphaera sp.]